jgi:multidrug efflux pump subunit AcrA (membrane-fusion protein)
MKRKRRVWIFGIGFIVIIAAGVALAMVLIDSESTQTGAKNGQATFTVERGEIKQTLVAYGKVTPKQEYTFTFDGDRVNEILVDVGQRVENNEVLASLDETQLELSMLQAERALKEAKAEGIPAIVREKELAYEIASSNYEGATLRAPFAGVVTAIDQATASSENWRIVLIDTSELYVEANVDQLDAPDVAEGQSAQATIEPLPDKIWPVEIVDVGGMAVTQGNSTTVSVTGKLPEADPSILVGYTVEMEILTAHAEDVLRVPISSLIESPRGWMVMKLVEGEPKPQQVKIGVTSDDYAEITDGLEEGDVILLNTASSPQDRTASAEEMRERFIQGGGPPAGGFPGMP